MNSICCGYGWQEFKIGRWWADANAAPPAGQEFLWQAVSCAGQVHARALIGDAFSHAQALRDALEDASTDLVRFDDSRFIGQVAALLADGELVLYRKVLTPEAAKKGFQVGPTPQKAGPAATGPATVKNVIAPKFSVPQKSAPINPDPPEPADNWLDQNLQAAALVLAALTGVPLVEICDKATGGAA